MNSENSAEHAAEKNACCCRIVGWSRDPYEPHIPARAEWEQADDCPMHPLPVAVDDDHSLTEVTDIDGTPLCRCGAHWGHPVTSVTTPATSHAIREAIDATAADDLADYAEEYIAQAKETS